MSDGNLKREILELISNAGVDADVLKVWDGKSYNHISLTEAISRKINEIKRDLMSIINCWFSKLEEEYSGTCYMQQIKEQYQKFEKWFGENSNI